MPDRFSDLLGNRRGSSRPDPPPPAPPAPWWDGLRAEGPDFVDIADWLQACHGDGCTVLQVDLFGLNEWRMLASTTDDDRRERWRIVSARYRTAIIELWPGGAPDGDHAAVAGPLLST
jgi:hypothetical protein